MEYYWIVSEEIAGNLRNIGRHLLDASFLICHLSLLQTQILWYLWG